MKATADLFRLPTFVILLAAMLHVCDAAAGESTLGERHADWESRIVYDESQIRFRAISTFEEGNDYVVLALDRYPNKCDLQYFQLNILADSPASRTTVTDNLFGAIRIDERPIHNISYQASFTKGERIFIVTVINFDGEETLLSELERGTNLRFKLKAGSQEYFFRFSLSGYPQAGIRTHQLCQAFAKEKKDEDFFNAPETRKSRGWKSDKQYF
jgi:hypothetical protein